MGLIRKFNQEFDSNSGILNIHGHTQGKGTERHNTIDVSHAVVKGNIPNLTQLIQMLRDKNKKHPNRILINKLRRQYDITWDYFNLILNNQNHCCAICKLKLDINFAYGYAIDHCHKTNKVRGILCRSCNIGLGVFKDSLLNLEAAIKYLKTDIQEEKHSA